MYIWYFATGISMGFPRYSFNILPCSRAKNGITDWAFNESYWLVPGTYSEE